MSDQRRPIAVGVELIQDLSAVSSPVQGYLRRHRHCMQTLLSDGTRTETYIHDFIDRDPSRRHAVTVAVWARSEGAGRGGVQVLLRRQFRYGAYQISGRALTTELVAGLIEGDEAPEETAAREVFEEAGIEVSAADVKPLGPALFAIPSIMTELMFPMSVEVAPAALEAAARSPLAGDGSPFEAGAEHLALSLDEAIALTEVDFAKAAPDQLFIADAKTEIALLRLARTLERDR